MGADFSYLYRQYDAINGAIGEMLAETSGFVAPLDPREIERRVLERQPSLDMGPETLAVVIRQAARDARVPLRD